MSSFDYVWAKCPVCGSDVEFQSKGGANRLNNYRHTSVPVEVATYLDNTCEQCTKCSTVVILKFEEMPRNVRMKALRLDDELEDEGDD